MFTEATAVTPLAPGRYAGEIQPGWDILGNANGGYLMAIAARAGMHAAEGRMPASLTAHFTAPGRPGPVTIDAEVIKVGRQFSTVVTTMRTDERPLLVAVGSYGPEPRGDHPIERIEAGPPDMPEPDECVPVEPTETFPPPFVSKVELRLHPEDAAGEHPAPRVRGWFRLRDGEPFDAPSLLVAVDAFPPPIFFAQLPTQWTPTLELTAHLRGLPASEWLRCRFSSRFISDGYVEEDGEVWDETGRLIAQSRQLALIGRG